MWEMKEERTRRSIGIRDDACIDGIMSVICRRL